MACNYLLLQFQRVEWSLKLLFLFGRVSLVSENSKPQSVGNAMKIIPFTIILLSLFVLAMPSFGLAEAAIIEQLTQDILQADSDADKSRLHMYRARNYKNMGSMDMAEEDYDAALAYDHKGWIHLERGKFYIGLGAYKQAKREAKAALKETPTLKGRARKIIAHAESKLKKAGRIDNPKEILLTKRWEATYTRIAPSSSGKPTIREAYAARNKSRAANRPARVSS